jgi:ubiquinone/menaquinone biosynthesis C-methylase UbiE
MTELKTSHLSEIYNNRFTEQTRDSRLRLWSILCQYWIQAYIPTDSTVLDLAAGQCEFINQIQAGHKIAVDLNQDIYNFAASDVRVIIAMSHDMHEVEEASVDVVFVSNFFEHLPTKQVLMDTLREIQRVLKPGGRLLILQPNIRFLHGEYWDFIDHYLPLTDRSLVEALELINMRVEEVRPRFLPYTTRSRLPQWSFLVHLYLLLPPAQWLLGKQAWVVAAKR